MEVVLKFTGNEQVIAFCGPQPTAILKLPIAIRKLKIKSQALSKHKAVNKNWLRDD